MAAVVKTAWRLQPLRLGRWRPQWTLPRAGGARLRSLRRLGGGRWRCHWHGAAPSQHDLHHVWHGPLWLCLRLRTEAGEGTIDLSVWRFQCTARGWHALRLWVARDQALARPAAER